MRARILFVAAACAALTTSSCSTLSRMFGNDRGGRDTPTAAPTPVMTPPAAQTAEIDLAVAVDNVAAPAAARVEVRDASVPVHLPQWDTVNLFAYRGVSLADLPEVVAVELDEAHGYCAPVVGRRLSPYGRRGRRNHNGTDVAVTLGQPVHCAFDGVVRLSRWNSGGFGHIIIVRHPSGLETYYAHLSKRTVRAGEVVKAGQTIGLGGRTGRATATHLHFETRYCDQSFDAERLIDFTTGELKTRTLALRKEYFSINSHAGDGDDPGDVLIDGGEGDLADNLAPGVVDAADFVPTTTASATAATTTTTTTTATSATTARKPSTQAVYHKIRGGDTLYSLARRYGTTVAKLCSLNGISSRTTLRIGRSLRMK